MTQRTPVVMSGDNTKHTPLEAGDKLAVGSIPISASSGNLIESRDDGIYYGTQAPEDVTNLYVDSQDGDDTNAGTRAAPLKTLEAAIGKVRATQSNTIWLHAGREYVLPSMYVLGGAQRIIRAYGDPYIDGDKVPTISPTIPHYYGEVVEAVDRPVIRPQVNYSTGNHVYSIRSAVVQNGGYLGFIGVKLDAHPVNDVDSGAASVPDDWDITWGKYNEGMIYGNAAGTVNFRGCTFSVPLRPAIFGDVNIRWWTIVSTGADGALPDIQFNHCNWPDDNGVTLVSATAASSAIYSTGWPSNPTASVADAPMLVDNMGSRLVEKDSVYGISRDSDNKPRNLSSNLIF